MENGAQCLALRRRLACQPPVHAIKALPDLVKNDAANATED
jgi:hypothetical protein